MDNADRENRSMRQRLRTGLLALLALASTRAAVAQQPATAPAPAPAAKAAVPPGPETLNQVVATVNGEPITRGEVLDFLSRYPVAPGSEKELYLEVVDYVANNKLLTQFLVRMKVGVTDKDLDDAVAVEERKLKAEQNRDLKTLLAEQGHDLPWLRKQISTRVALEKYIAAVATDAELKKFLERNKDIFSRAQVRASHIFLAVPPGATTAAKEAVRQKLAAIRAEIDSLKISFPDAANKYSEDDANKQAPNGGDLGYFLRKGAYLDSFAAKAFSMAPNTISEPFESEYGFHLIQVTDRKPGEPFDPDQNRAFLLNQYRADLMERIISQERKTAKIVVKEMPADLFPPAPAQPPASAPPGTVPAAKGAAPR
jgi:peptidyl-prolyl cis-trans isomerase C